MKKYLLGFVLFVCLSLNSQNIVTYKFIDEYRLRYKGERNERTELLFGESFNYQRIFLNDSLFKENLFDGKLYKIKIKNGCWYIKKTGKWQLFYSPYKIATPRLKIYFANKNSWWFDFKAVRTDTLFGYNCIIYEMIPITIQRGKIIKEFDLAHLPIYWFSPELGIIYIQTGGATNYIREDIISDGVTL